MFEEFDLSGRVAVVTGAGTGIGRATALLLARRGADIVAVGRKRPALDAVVREIEVLGRSGLAVEADVRELDPVQNMVDTAATHFGRLDILVNNAGALTGTSGSPRCRPPSGSATSR
ncbi:SDR family NAD(P)-dependent oxidoreductase [Novosphingobium panipatense]|uniref:SDR family NAD(P)-dependent oxidoreductase n=1 Tax=Novosphingobium panipatense TaxID=428991 RepID=UPI003619BC9B